MKGKCLEKTFCSMVVDFLKQDLMKASVLPVTENVGLEYERRFTSCGGDDVCKDRVYFEGIVDR